MALSLEALDSMQPVGSREPTRSRHIAVIGSSGVGKTTWAAKGPERVLVILTEPQAGGRIRDTNPNAFVIGDTVETAIRSRDDIKVALQWAAKQQTAVQPDGRVGRFDRIVLDSATEMIRMIADEIDKEALSAGASEQTRATPGKASGEWNHTHWANFEKRATVMLRAFRDIPNTQIVCIFLDELQKGDDGAAGTRRMQVNRRAMAGRVASFFDLVFWLVTTTKKGTGADGKPTERTVHALRTGSPGFYDGNFLEQGKGHTSLPLWLDANVYTPGRVLSEISKAAPECGPVDTVTAVEPAGEGDLPESEDATTTEPAPAASSEKKPESEPAVKPSSKKGGKAGGK